MTPGWGIVGQENMSGRSDFIENGGHLGCKFPERWQEVHDDRKAFKDILTRIEGKLDTLANDHNHHVTKMFQGNGKPAIIPTLENRLTLLETAMVPHDDVVEMVNAFKIGKGCIISIASVAALGFLAILFWHLFQKVKP
jgi:hypothetical protein